MWKETVVTELTGSGSIVTEKHSRYIRRYLSISRLSVRRTSDRERPTGESRDQSQISRRSSCMDFYTASSQNNCRNRPQCGRSTSG
jgi:hypothetical protein